MRITKKEVAELSTEFEGSVEFFASTIESNKAREALTRERTLERDYFQHKLTTHIKKASSIEELQEILGAIPQLPGILFVRFPNEDEDDFYSSYLDEFLDYHIDDCEVDAEYNLDFAVVEKLPANLNLSYNEAESAMIAAFHSLLQEGIGFDPELIELDNSEEVFLKGAMPALVAGLKSLYASRLHTRTKLIIQLRTTLQDVLTFLKENDNLVETLEEGVDQK